MHTLDGSGDLVSLAAARPKFGRWRVAHAAPTATTSTGAAPLHVALLAGNDDARMALLSLKRSTAGRFARGGGPRAHAAPPRGHRRRRRRRPATPRRRRVAEPARARRRHRALRGGRRGATSTCARPAHAGADIDAPNADGHFAAPRRKFREHSRSGGLLLDALSLCGRARHGAAGPRGSLRHRPVTPTPCGSCWRRSEPPPPSTRTASRRCDGRRSDGNDRRGDGCSSHAAAADEAVRGDATDGLSRPRAERRRRSRRRRRRARRVARRRAPARAPRQARSTRPPRVAAGDCGGGRRRRVQRPNAARRRRAGGRRGSHATHDPLADRRRRRRPRARPDARPPHPRRRRRRRQGRRWCAERCCRGPTSWAARASSAARRVGRSRRERRSHCPTNGYQRGVAHPTHGRERRRGARGDAHVWRLPPRPRRHPRRRRLRVDPQCEQALGDFGLTARRRSSPSSSASTLTHHALQPVGRRRPRCRCSTTAPTTACSCRSSRTKRFTAVAPSPTAWGWRRAFSASSSWRSRSRRASRSARCVGRRLANFPLLNISAYAAGDVDGSPATAIPSAPSPSTFDDGRRAATRCAYWHHQVQRDEDAAQRRGQLLVPRRRGRRRLLLSALARPRRRRREFPQHSTLEAAVERH